MRPHPGKGRVLVQLDDLDREKVNRVRELAFLTIETSPRKFSGVGSDHQLKVREQKYGSKVRLSSEDSGRVPALTFTRAEQPGFVEAEISSESMSRRFPLWPSLTWLPEES